MKQCPVCRAKWRGKAECRRCKSDLTALILLEQRSRDTMRQAVQQLKQGNIQRARRLCIRSSNLKRSEFAERLTGFLDSLTTG